ncbi:MAG: mechanosensitive ion channel [Acidobacteria bacterium]|jgi:small-conductance mechanosensitive channel|nr:mechanosensitive ion channel [Acidobacteriota bacterium]
METGSWSVAVRDVAAALTEGVASRLPDLVGAVLIVLVGWAVGRLLSALLRRLLARGLDRLQGSRLLSGEDRVGWRRVLPRLIGGLAFWTVMAVAVVAAADTLELGLVAELLSTLARLLPQVLAGVLVVFVGVVFAELAHRGVANAATAAGVPYAEALARAVQISVIVVALVMGAHQAGIDSTFLMITLPVLLGALLGGAALAFGLGSRTAVSNIIASYQLTRLHEVGQRVRIAGLEGRIERVTPTAVVLDAADGRIVVPAKLFSEEIAVILVGAER